MRIAQYYAILLRANSSCFNLLSFQIFFGFTFNTKLFIFKAKTKERKLFYRQINLSRVLFSFPSARVMNAFCNEAVAICCENVAYLRGKKFPCISQGMKNIAY